jgi:peptide/nickel transport system substrate-binding protein
VDKILDQAQTTIDENERQDLYFQAQEMLVEDAPWVPIAYAKPPLGFQKSVSGYQASPTGGEAFNTVSLSGGA